MGKYAEGTSVPVERSQADELEKTWLAGVFEGEGTISIIGHRGAYTRIVVSVTSTDRNMVEPFAKRWQANLTEYTPKTSLRARLAYTWRLSCGRAVQFLWEMDRFFRTARVRRKSFLAIFADSCRRKGNRNEVQGYRKMHEDLRQQMAVLNKRGV